MITYKSEEKVRCLNCHWQGDRTQTRPFYNFDICPRCQTFDSPSGGPAIIEDDVALHPPWMIEAHKVRKPNFETRTCSPDDWGYRSGFHPFQVVIQAAGWKAKVLAFIFRIKPCCYTFTDKQYWPVKELL